VRAGEELSRQDGRFLSVARWGAERMVRRLSFSSGLNLLIGPRARRMPMEGFFFAGWDLSVINQK
jgi:hypothetical protein